MELTFTLPSDAASSTVYIGAGIRNTTGTIWVDNVQLEEGNLANRYNLIENGDFTYKGLGWTSWYDASTDAAVIPTTDPAHPTSLSTNVYPIKGDSTLNKAISQNVKVSGGKGDAFVFSGWGRADSLPIEDYRHFSLSVGINNTDNSTAWKTIHFNEETPDWQYVAQEIVAEKDYASVDIFLLYYKNLNTAYFDGIQLYKEEFGGRYTYNSAGNLEQLNDTNYYYDEDQNLVQVEENGDYSQITYDSSGQPINIESNLSESSAIEYDQYGNIKTTKYGNNLFINSENTYTEDGNYATSSGELGSLSKTVYDYDRTTGNLTKMQTNGKNVRSFEYDKVDNVTKIADATGVGSETNDVLFDYSNDEVSKITRNNFSYNFNYDAYSRLKEFLVKDSLIYSNSYENLNGQLEKTRFSTGFEVKNSFDLLGRLTSISSWNVNNNIQKTLTEFKYNNNNLLHEKLDRVLNISYRYKYDLEGNLYEVNGSDGSKRELYQNVEVGTQLTDSYGLNTFKRNYIENQAQNQSIVIFDNPNAQFETEFDSLGRTSKNNIKTGSNTFSSSYTYFDEAITGSTKLKNIINPLASINLIYDEANKILKQVESGHETLYEYDSLGELVKELNTSENKTTLYKYDQGGNITKKEVYNIEDVQFQNPISINHYRYDNEVWRDQLTSFNNSPLQYDSVGNTTNFDGWLYQWEDGNRLVSASKGTDAISYTYDEYGIRTSKKINGKETRFTVYDQKVAFENDGTNLIYYTYDDTGDIIAFNYNGASYYYVKNHLKDVIGILDGSGTVVVKYKYDTFGKVNDISGDLKDSIGVVNPYRYRSYRYDFETGLYYLNSRYYSPILGRFISPDLIEFLGENGGSISYNLYAYGNNDWINYLDPSGNFVLETLNLLIRGTIHNIVGILVQAQLIQKGRKAETNVQVIEEETGRKGFLDVLDITNMKFYEVKPFNTVEKRWSLVDKQTKRYIRSTWNNKKITGGTEKYKGWFFWNGRYVSFNNDPLVRYVIVYRINNDPVTNKILSKNGVKIKSTRQLESNRTKIIIGVGIGGFAFGAGMGGNRLPNLQFAQ